MNSLRVRMVLPLAPKAISCTSAPWDKTRKTSGQWYRQKERFTRARCCHATSCALAAWRLDLGWGPAVLAGALTTLGGLLPARQAAKKEILTALREV